MINCTFSSSIIVSFEFDRMKYDILYFGELMKIYFDYP